MNEDANRKRSGRITRRKFVGRTLLATCMAGAAPAFLRGQNLNNKLNIAFIACGGRATASLSELTLTEGRSGSTNGNRSGGTHPDENVAVVWHINRPALDSASQRYPKAPMLVDLH